MTTFCEDIIPLIPDGLFDEKRTRIRAKYALALRMAGESGKAKTICEEILEEPLDNDETQSVLNNLAMCYEDLEQIPEAIAAAERVIKLDRHSSFGLQARSLLIELAADDPHRGEKLEAHEKLARKREATTVANNIALIRASEADDAGCGPDEIRAILLPVVKANSKDFYNKTRATLQLAKLSLDMDQPLSDAEEIYLIGAYHFLFNERLPSMFDDCHEALWEVFTRDRDHRNLLALFRHSSLYWRLRGRDKIEKAYLSKLARTIGSSLSSELIASREAAYYLIRASLNLAGLLPK
jgi:tetratricopeptide (TPR) repeat protein